MIGGISGSSEVIFRPCNFGYDVDNDNMPAPENMPTLYDVEVTIKLEG